MIKTTKEIKQEPILNACRIQKERDNKLWVDVEKLTEKIKNLIILNFGNSDEAVGYNMAIKDVLKLIKK